MSFKFENKGITDLGSVVPNNFVISQRASRTMPIVLAANQGVLKAGTLVQSNTNGKYVICNDAKKLSGVLLEAYDTGTGGSTADVKATMAIDIDLRSSGVFSQVTALPDGFYPSANILIKGE